MKLIRLFHSSLLQLINNHLPSFLGSGGLLLVLLSAKGIVSNLKVYQALVLTVFISVLIEYLQIIPRPGILAKVYYVFDEKDIAASMMGILFSFILITCILLVKETEKE